MKLLLIFATVLSCVHLSFQKTDRKCLVADGDGKDLKNMDEACSTALKEQINREFVASITYLAMSAHFQSETRFRPGLSKFFLDSSAEERVHAKKMMEFLLLRGVAVKDAALPPVLPAGVSWTSAEAALKAAYDLEKAVTENIENIIEICEAGKSGGKNDYHTVDYFTSEFLAEQHEGLRKISEHITSLSRMGVGSLGELLFDKTLMQD